MKISDLRIRSKLALVLTLLVVPILLLAWLFITQSFKDIDFAQKESDGVAYLRGVWHVLTDLVAAPFEALPAKSIKPSDIRDLDQRYGAAMDTADAAKILTASLESIGWPRRPTPRGESTEKAIENAR